MPQMREPISPNSTSSRLKEDIDRGKTGDKVRFPDPAAAPLGTDEEAAATPPSRAAIAQARMQESQRTSPAADVVTRTSRGPEGWSWFTAMVITALVLALALLAWLLAGVR